MQSSKRGSGLARKEERKGEIGRQPQLKTTLPYWKDKLWTESLVLHIAAVPVSNGT